jgi:CRISPR-associated protein Csx16
MTTTLITFAGTGDYAETVYQWRGVGDYRSQHIAAALGKLWKATAIVVLATQAAEDKNGNRLRDSLAAASLPQPVFKRLPDGRTEEELWTQFQAMREAIALAAGSDVLIDITHGFRAQPFFAGAVLSLLRASGLKSHNLALVYGEYRQHQPISPIWDITLFIELMDWAQALGLFLQTGVAGSVVELGREVQRREAKKALATNTRVFPTFGQLVEAIEQFAADLATVRVASMITGYEQEDSRKRNARGSAARLVDAIEKCREEVASKLPPLALILNQLAKSVRPLSADRLYGEDGQRAQYALARHYLNLTRYPEAAVVVREAQVNKYAQDECAVEVNSLRFDDLERKVADIRFGGRDPDKMEIGDIRNDIEHGGFRKQPMSARALQTRIDQLVQRFAPVDSKDGDGARAEAAPPVGGRTLFVTRHPGAVEWAARQGIAVDKTVAHLDPDEIRPGDVVIGTLPVHLAAEVCAHGARYLHLVLDLPGELRGRELSAEQLLRLGARLEEYSVERTS